MRILVMFDLPVGTESEMQIKELYKATFYYKINLLLVEAHQGKNLECEKNQLIDEDMCFIHY